MVEWRLIVNFIKQLLTIKCQLNVILLASGCVVMRHLAISGK